jgi:hypothetical protein
MRLRAERDAEEFLGHCRLLMETLPTTFDNIYVGDTRLWWKRLFIIVDRFGLRVMWRSECEIFWGSRPFYKENSTDYDIGLIRYVLPALREATLLDRLASV